MADDDDDWETDADFENNVTEQEQRAFGNAETRDKYNAVNDKMGSSIPGEYKPRLASSGVPPTPTPPVPTPAAQTPAAQKSGWAANYLAPAAGEPPAATPDKLNIPGKLPAHPAAFGSAGKLPLNSVGKSLGQDPLGSTKDALSSAPSTATPRSNTTKNVLNRNRRVSDKGSKELNEIFMALDTNESGTLDFEEMLSGLERLQMPMPKDKLAAILKEVDVGGKGHVTFTEFINLIDRVKTYTAGASKVFSQVVAHSDGSQRNLLKQKKEGGIVHSFAEDECAAFVDFINSKLGWDSQLAYLLPMQQTIELFAGCSDGVLLCRLINIAVAETIDERVINVQPNNRFLINENLNLAINAAKSIGLTVVNIGASDLIEGRPHLVLGLVWQIVKTCLLSHINLKENPNLIRLLQEGETIEQLLKLPPEKLLVRWFNHHLAEAGVSKRINNFGGDLKDSEAYAHLLKQIDPEMKCTLSILSNNDPLARATYVATNGGRLTTEFRVQPVDIVSGNEKLNMAFVAALFNACPGLEPPKEEEVQALMEEIPEDDVGDTREERAFRMWINSLGIESCPYVDNLFDDLRDGEVILHTMDHVMPRVVDWTRVNKKPTMVFKRIENLNYAVTLGLGPFHFSLVGVQGKDIADGNKKLTLALIWQLMRFHLVGFLASLRTQRGGGGSMSDTEMVQWANQQVSASGRTSTMRDFSDKSLASGVFLIDMLAAVEPRCINLDLVTPGESEEDRKLNAKYVISSARKIGCSLFLLWEDIVDVRPKMILSFVATVMSLSEGRRLSLEIAPLPE